MEVGDHVGEAGGRIAQHLPPDVHVPAAEAAGHGDGHEADPGGAHQLEDVGVGGGLDGDPLPAPGEESADGVDGAHRARGDHDLLGHGRNALLGVAVGEHPAQRGQARRVVPVGVRVRRQLLQGALDGLGEPRFGGRERGAAEVDHRAEGLGRQRFEAPGGQRVPGRDGGPAAGAAAGLQEPLAPQGLVGGGDGGAAEGEGDGQFPLGGQPGGDGDAAFEDEQADAVGEGPVGGQLARPGDAGPLLLGGDEAGELCGTDR